MALPTSEPQLLGWIIACFEAWSGIWIRCLLSLFLLPFSFQVKCFPDLSIAKAKFGAFISSAPFRLPTCAPSMDIFFDIRYSPLTKIKVLLFGSCRLILLILPASLYFGLEIRSSCGGLLYQPAWVFLRVVRPELTSILGSHHDPPSQTKPGHSMALWFDLERYIVNSLFTWNSTSVQVACQLVRFDNFHITQSLPKYQSPGSICLASSFPEDSASRNAGEGLRKRRRANEKRAAKG